MSIFGGNKNNKNINITSVSNNIDETNVTYVKKHKFAALGGYDARSSENYNNIKAAMAQLKIKDDLVRVHEIKEIATYGTMQTPGFAINGQVVSYGRSISTETAKTLIAKSGVLHNNY